MCGIAGIVGTASHEVILRMTQILKHRGPDDIGTKCFPTHAAALGHTRLSIIDLSPLGHQPMVDASGHLWITFNGEIYNFQEIRETLIGLGHSFRSHSDTEVLLAAYTQWGRDCLHRLNGMFAFAIFDERDGSLFLARDRLGIKPLYYAQTPLGLLFASEIKSLFASGVVQPEPDYVALATPAMFQVGPLTGFEGVRKLQPGHYLTFKNGNLRIAPYWQVTPTETLSDLNTAAEQLDHLLQDSIRLQMIADVPVGLLLSGGLDSSFVLALMAKRTTSPIRTFTIRFREADQKFEQMPDDSPYARQVSEQFGSQHHEIEISPDIVSLLPKMMWHLDEPLADPAAINTYLISEAARRDGVKVLLNGMGADEVFGGYRKHLACLLADHYQAFVPPLVRRGIERIAQSVPAATSSKGIRTARWAKRFVNFASLPPDIRYLASSGDRPKDVEALLSGPRLGSRGYESLHFVREQLPSLNHPKLSYLTRMCLADTRFYLPDHNLLYSDKCTMAAGVEGRPILIDHRIVELMFTSTPKLRVNRRTQKHLLRHVATRYLPESIIHRPKAPFGSPLRSWIRGPLNTLLMDTLSPATLNRRGLFNTRYLLSKIEADKRGIEDNSHLLWRALCLEIWFQTFADSSVAKSN